MKPTIIFISSERLTSKKTSALPVAKGKAWIGWTLDRIKSGKDLSYHSKVKDITNPKEKKNKNQSKTFNKKEHTHPPAKADYVSFAPGSW